MTDRPAIIPPSNIEAEQALLGAILFNNRAYDKVADFLRPEHFAQGVHGRIYAAIAKLIGNGEIANPVTLKLLFDKDEALAEIGGAKYLARLSTSVVTILNSEDYGRTIVDCAEKRQLIEIGEQLIETGQLDRSAVTSATLIEQTETALYEIAERGRSGSGLVSVQNALRSHARLVEEAYKAGGKPIGTATGLADLDDMIGGLKPGCLVMLGGRPSMGKSLVAGCIAFNVARSGKRVAIFSPEQTKEMWAARWLARLTSLPTDRQDRGDLNDNDWSRFIGASEEIERLPLLIDDTPGISAHYVRHAARRAKRQGGLGLVIVDHLQKMRQGGRQENRRLEIGDITGSLAGLAKELGVPVLLVSQLSRANEKRDDRRPQLGDLRESGDIEQDADVVLFVYRQSYYLERRPPEKREGETDDAFAGRENDYQDALGKCRNIAELIADKNRGGPVGTVRVFFDGARSLVMDLDRGATP